MSSAGANREDVLETLRMLQHSASRLQHRIDDAIHQLKDVPSSDLDNFICKQRNMLAVWCEEEIKILDELGSVQGQQQTGEARVEARPGGVHDNGTEGSETSAPVGVAVGQALLGDSSSFISRDKNQRSVQYRSDHVSMNKIVAMGGVPVLGRMVLPLQQPDPGPQEADANSELNGENA